MGKFTDPSIFDITDPTTTASAGSSFLMSVTEFKTKILTVFENEIRVSFLLIVNYYVTNICTNFKQTLLKRSMQKKVLLSNCTS